ncbi:peptidoglycan DD-metalloendopeptidase family protein (plasmid) [Bacillus mycoides]|nr:peptidoglycan DD-metalloendopeptidase family protein [Bacillus mycoides]
MKYKLTSISMATVAITSFFTPNAEGIVQAAEKKPVIESAHSKTNNSSNYNNTSKENRNINELGEANNKEQYIVNVNAVNVRSKPTIHSNILTVFQKGQLVSIQDIQGGWYRVIYKGSIGYIKKEFLSKSSQPEGKKISLTDNTIYEVSASALNIRSGPSTNNTIVGLLYKGTNIQVTEEVGLWYKIQYGNQFGYVSKKYILQKQQNKQPNSNKQQADFSETKLFKFPTNGTISSRFEKRWGHMHYGLDIAAVGNVPIHAAATGTVAKSYYSTSYGNVIFIKHNINKKIYTTVYAHMKNRTVKVGDRVNTGDFLGYMGNTGDSLGQHLHFELHTGEWNLNKTNAIDPLPF